MKKFWLWLCGLFGYKVPTIPPEIHEDTTAPIIPNEYNPDEVNSILQGTSESKMDGDSKMDVVLSDAPPPVEEDEVIPIDDGEPKPSKYAVLIGINKYDPSLDANLNGCVNDVEAMYDILVNTYNFPPDNIRMVTDFRATGDEIFSRIEWLIDHTIPGDELVLHYSGHGSQVRDRDGDELADELDEIICPTDLDWDYPFTDDDIAHLFKQKVDGVSLTFICDSCHSGSISKELKMSAAPTTTVLSPRPRYIKPPVDILYRGVDRDLPVNTFGAVNKEVGPIDQKHVLLSGCRDDQTSADAYIDGKWQGALTASLIKAIKNNPYRDWASIHAEVISILNVGGYSQRPQLSGNADLVKGKNVFGA